MKYLIWPISLFIAEYLSINFPVYYGNRIQIYIFILFICLALLQSKGDIPKNIVNKNILAFIGIALIIQFASMMLSHYRIDIPQYNKSPIKTFIAFCSFAAAIMVHYVVIRLNVHGTNDIKKFLTGGWIALILSLVVCFIQLAYIFMPGPLDSLLRLFGSTVEARWGGQVANLSENSFYKLGSYVQTTSRINGLTEEASNLATQFFVIFVPFILASIKNNYNVFFKNYEKTSVLYVTLAMIVVLMLMAKTTSGFLFAAVILLVLMKDLSQLKKLFLISSVVLATLLVLIFNFKSVYLVQTLNDFLLNKEGNSVSNRSGSMIALLIVSLKHFIFGIGWEYHTYFIFDNLPEWAKHNSEYFSFVKKKEYPIMSVLLGWTAQFGIIIVGLVIAYVIKTQKNFRKLSNQALELKLEDAQLTKVLCDASFYYLLFTLISALFLYVWYASVYLIIYFFFISIIYVTRKNITTYVSKGYEESNGKN